MLGRSNCCAPQRTCYNNTYDDYDELSQKGGGNNGFKTCRPSFKENLCNRIKRVQESSKILENVLDISSTLVKIMCVCGIHECKANKALDVIIYAFMHFDEVSEHPGGKCKKRIRKEEFYNDLMRDCGMTKAEAKLTYSIVKCAFKAFYHKQIINKYDAGFVDECEWKNAANRTITAFGESGASKSDIELTGRRILCAYENYMCRLQAKRQGRGSQQDVNKCVCNKNRRSSLGGSRGFPSFDPCPPQQAFPPPCPPEPPLCGELCCQIVCPPGASCPQLVCKDACGRTFLKVDGNRVNFDPIIMECEAKRAAMRVCPQSDADRIKSLRESLDVCQPKETDSCDRILADICKENDGDERSDICEDEGDNNYYKEPSDHDTRDPRRNKDEAHSGGGGDAGNERDRHDKTDDDRQGDNQDKKDRDTDKYSDRDRDRRQQERDNYPDRDRDRRQQERDNYPDRDSDRRQQERDNYPERSDRVGSRLNETESKGQFQSGMMSITVKFNKEANGINRMEVDMQGYGPPGTRAPDNINAFRVIANKNLPVDYACVLLDANDVRSIQSRRITSSAAEEGRVASIHENTKRQTLMETTVELAEPFEPPATSTPTYTPRGSKEQPTVAPENEQTTITVEEKAQA